MPRYDFNERPPLRRYRHVRGAMNSEIRALPDDALESVMARAGIDANAAEDWLSSVARIGAQVLPVAGQVVGTVYGGPAGGALGGALGGLAGNALGQLAGEPARRAPGPAPSATPSPATPAPAGAPPIPASGASAATDLARFLMRREVQAAILALAAGGQVGAPNARVGNVAIPASTIAETVGHLAQRASAEYEATYGETTSAAYIDAVPGNYDATDPVSRSEAVQAVFEREDEVRQRMARAHRAGQARVASKGFGDADDGADDAPDDGWSDRDFNEAALLIDALADMEG
jgi:hypothetical protein